MPVPLMRTETLIFHLSQCPCPLMTKTKYYAQIEARLPGCNPYSVDIELTRFYEQFRAEVHCRATLPGPNPKQATSALGTGRIAPTWMFDPDELLDKIYHLCCHLTRTAWPDDDDISALFEKCFVQ
jgi:hypothetical protein